MVIFPCRFDILRSNSLGKICFNKFLCSSKDLTEQIWKKFREITLYENDQNNERQNVGNVNANPAWEKNTSSTIGLFSKIIPSPTAFLGTEK